MLETTTKYGVKVMIISPMDYADYCEVLSAIQAVGYTITVNDNGTATCEKSAK
jgi:hypothetical protein